MLDFAPVIPANIAKSDRYSWQVRVQPTGSRTLLDQQNMGGAFFDETQTGSGSAGADSPLIQYAGRGRVTNPQEPESFWAGSEMRARF